MKNIDEQQGAMESAFRNTEEAERYVCQTIASLGRLAGIEVDQGEGPEDIDAVLIEAAYQSNFDDPQFLGGPSCFNIVQTSNDVERLQIRANHVMRGLLGYIRKRATDETVRRAEAHIGHVDLAFAWLGETVENMSQKT